MKSSAMLVTKINQYLTNWLSYIHKITNLHRTVTRSQLIY